MQLAKPRPIVFDTEFAEDGRTIELISIGMIDLDGRTYHAVNETFMDDPVMRACANDWVQANVIAKLPPRESGLWRPKSQIRDDIIEWVGDPAELGEPEFWAYFADYDWVAFCQLFGTMMDLPDGYPKYCRDLKQLADSRGFKRSDLPPQDEAEAHDALVDAHWGLKAYQRMQHLTELKLNSVDDILYVATGMNQYTRRRIIEALYHHGHLAQLSYPYQREG